MSLKKQIDKLTVYTIPDHLESSPHVLRFINRVKRPISGYQQRYVQWDDFPFEHNFTYKFKSTRFTIIDEFVEEVRFNKSTKLILTHKKKKIKRRQIYILKFKVRVNLL